MARFLKYIIGISASILVVSLIAYVILFMNNGQKTFYVQYGELEIRTKVENIELPVNKVLVFECKNSFGLGTKDFTVKIGFNSDFGFDVDNAPYQAKVLDISKNFNVVKDNELFTLYIPDSLTLFSIIQNAFPDKAITAVPVMESGKDYFKIVVESTKNERDIIQINFRLGV